VRTVATKTVNYSTKLLSAWKQAVLDHGKKPKILPRDVKTRWNSTFDMINTALAYKKVIRDFTLDETNGLQSYVISTLE
ncbi:hypothetical protein DFH08DRAFT_701395, partial [Mycena albidolilacea]